MTPIVHLTTGYPASGKTTLAKLLVEESEGRTKRVNLDDIRAMTANGVYSKENEQLALAVQDKTVLAAVQQGFDVVVDNTHLHPKVPNRLRTILACEHVSYQVHDFLDVSVEECIRRDRLRARRGERAVGAAVIEKMASQRRSWRLTADYMREWHGPRPYTPAAGTPRAVICDLDGTLALPHGRSPYDTARCGEDRLNRALSNLLWSMQIVQDIHPIMLTGRDSQYRPQTVEWLRKNNVPYHRLFMRAAGDRRRDDIVKAELFDRHLRDTYDVLMAFDDRDRVVKLWRAMGIMTAQMDYGDF
ncbi:AAA family ATPase [Streptomyces sp. NPDC017448]|uniref:phosphatase domain-containing protein n=1 Tax=Streptomyces sp. NPDC017448 TaxID=3364996 RepID=UPI00378DA0B1